MHNLHKNVKYQTFYAERGRLTLQQISIANSAIFLQINVCKFFEADLTKAGFLMPKEKDYHLTVEVGCFSCSIYFLHSAGKLSSEK